MAIAAKISSNNIIMSDQYLFLTKTMYFIVAFENKTFTQVGATNSRSVGHAGR